MASVKEDWRSIDPAKLRGMRKEDMTPQQRMAVAHRGMEESSGDCVRILHKTVDMADETSKELYRQSESLDRTEANLDCIGVDLELSRRNMREIKSVWGGVANKISDCLKPPKIRSMRSSSQPPPDRSSQKDDKKGPVQAQAQAKSSQPPPDKSSQKDDKKGPVQGQAQAKSSQPPPDKNSQKDDKKGPVQAQAQAKSSKLLPDRSSQKGDKKGPAQAQAKSSTGNEIVDRNLDELEKGLRMLEGQNYLIGNQLDESIAQIDRIKEKVDKSNIRLTKINRDINGELRR